MKTTQYILNTITAILLLLWIPVLVHQLVNFDAFRAGLLRQPFSDTLGHVLAYALPVLELLVVLSLVANRSKKLVISTKNEETSQGSREARSEFFILNPYLLSTILLTAFTVYIITALAGMWSKLPCGCGSVIKDMTWQQHLWFNLFFLMISLSGLILNDRNSTDHLSSNTQNTSRKISGSEHLRLMKSWLTHLSYKDFHIVAVITFHLRFPRKYALFPGRPVRK